MPTDTSSSLPPGGEAALQKSTPVVRPITNYIELDREIARGRTDTPAEVRVMVRMLSEWNSGLLARAETQIGKKGAELHFRPHEVAQDKDFLAELRKDYDRTCTGGAPRVMLRWDRTSDRYSERFGLMGQDSWLAGADLEVGDRILGQHEVQARESEKMWRLTKIRSDLKLILEKYEIYGLDSESRTALGTYDQSQMKRDFPGRYAPAPKPDAFATAPPPPGAEDVEPRSEAAARAERGETDDGDDGPEPTEFDGSDDSG